MRTAKFTVLLSILFVGSNFNAPAQTSVPGQVNAIKNLAPSPEAASLGKFGDIPVGLYSGIPSISVPITQLSVGEIKLPISLDYHAAGIRVDEVSSCVGLGWALNAGGTISLSINGLKDDENSPLPNFYNFNPNFYSGTTDYALAKNIARGYIDGAPDTYYFNFSGQSGQFVFKGGDARGYPIPYENLKIQRVSGNISIIDERGIKYFFNALEQTSYQKSGSYCGSSDVENNPPTETSNSWMLTRIESPTGRWINFNYTGKLYTYVQSKSQSDYHIIPNQYGCSNLDFTPIDCQTNATVSGNFVNLITTDDGTSIQFMYDNLERRDLPGTYALLRIQVSNNGVNKNYDLSHSYFESNGSSTNPDDYRLKLDMVTEEGHGPYAFSYNYNPQTGIVLPSRLSTDVDYWGYYNHIDGLNSNNSLLPAVVSGPIPIEGANREVEPEKMKYLVLNKMTYPTGGFTTFDFGANKYTQPAGPTGKIIRTTFEAGSAWNDTRPFTQRTFMVPQNAANIILGYTFTNCPGSTTTGDYCVLKLVNADDPNDASKYALFFGPGDVHLTTTLSNLGPIEGHKFYMTVEHEGECECGGTLRWDALTEEVLTVPTLRPVGGLRIEKLSTYTSINDTKPVVKKYEYLVPNTSASSGLILYKPKMDYLYTSVSGTSMDLKTCQYIARTSTSITPLGILKGGAIAYTSVTELNGENGENGKSISEFAITGDVGATAAVPFAPATSYDFQRGQLLTKTDYRYNVALNKYEQVKRIENEYQFLQPSDFWYFRTNSTPNEVNVVGLKVFETQPESVSNNSQQSIPLVTPAHFEYYPFKVISAWIYLKSSKEYTFNAVKDVPIDETKFLKNTTDYFYDNPTHAQVTRIIKSDSKGNIITTYKTYPEDYDGSGNMPSILSLKNNHLVNYPIEQVNVLSNASSNHIISGTLSVYNANGTKSADQILETSQPIEVSSFKFSNRAMGVIPMVGNASAFSADIHYKPKVIYDVYDLKGNLRTYHKDNDISFTYLWGYNGSFPVAQITNASYANVSGLVNQNVLDNATNSYTDNDIRTELNKLRSGLASLGIKALVTTFTYKPLFGMTSQTDFNNRTTFYEYDNYGRLNLIRDHNQNIVKKYDYKYFNQ